MGSPGETVWRVPPLTVPDAVEAGAPDGGLAIVMQAEAVRLFDARATAALPAFALTEQQGPAIAQICRRLDGIPLAIELAAARLRGLTLEQLAVRLDDHLRLLTSGNRAALPRHQTLRAMVDWSHDLLSEPERVLFRRLSVFAGGWTLEAAERVCAERHDRRRRRSGAAASTGGSVARSGRGAAGRIRRLDRDALSSPGDATSVRRGEAACGRRRCSASWDATSAWCLSLAQEAGDPLTDRERPTRAAARGRARQPAGGASAGA